MTANVINAPSRLVPRRAYFLFPSLLRHWGMLSPAAEGCRSMGAKPLPSSKFYNFFKITHFKHILILIFVQNHVCDIPHFYLLPWPEDNHWYNESPLRTNAKNMRPSNKNMQICKMKNWRKIKDRTYCRRYVIGLKLNKRTNVKTAHFESFMWVTTREYGGVTTSSPRFLLFFQK